jgi:hypothetical protein
VRQDVCARFLPVGWKGGNGRSLRITASRGRRCVVALRTRRSRAVPETYPRCRQQGPDRLPPHLYESIVSSCLRSLSQGLHRDRARGSLTCRGFRAVPLGSGLLCTQHGQETHRQVKHIRQSATHATTPMDQSHSGVTRWLRFDNAGSGLGLSDDGDHERQSYSPGNVPGPE